jgi:hypothetical protein
MRPGPAATARPGPPPHQFLSNGVFATVTGKGGLVIALEQ